MALLLLLFGRPALADVAAADGAVRRGDHAAAYEACKAAVEQGDPACQNLVGILFRQGLGVAAASPEEAVRLFRLAAAKKLAAAQYNLGLAYLNGLGAPRDDAQAAHWFSQAAGQGDILGEYQLALLLMAGKGIERDRERAIELLRHGADRAFVPAQLALAFVYEAGPIHPHRPMLAYMWYRIAQRFTRDATLRARAADGEKRALLQLSGQEVGKRSVKSASRGWREEAMIDGWQTSIRKCPLRI